MPRPGLLAAAALLAACHAPAPAPPRAERVVLVTIDGLRWQEVLAGADNQLMNRDQGGVRDLLDARRRYWRGEPAARRELLLPFLWREVVADGQLFGDAGAGSPATVTNAHRFSYPGYSELLCGFADARIDSNDKRPNPNVTVLEWLAGRPGFAGSVAAFASWDVFPWIVNTGRSGVPVNAGWMPITAGPDAARLQALQDVAAGLPRYWAAVRYDALTFHAAAEYVKAHRPRVLYLALGETDDWAHDRRYDLYLQMAQQSDAFVRQLWQLLQSLDEYRGRTALVVTTDHGRGDGARWTDHGKDVAGADRIWMAVRGPGVPALGVRPDAPMTQAQVAATVAALLGEDFTTHDGRIAPPPPGVVDAR